MKGRFAVLFMVVMFLSATAVNAAYHHMGEEDSDNFIEAYPAKAGTKLDHCALCHSGGSYTNSKGKTVEAGSCQWCHEVYKFEPPHGDIDETMNQFGRDYKTYGRDAAVFSNTAFLDLDSDGDGFGNNVEIDADRYPGDDSDDPDKKTAPYRVYTKSQLEAMASHTQFMLMNTSRGGTTGLDSYDEYTGIIVEDLLKDAGMLSSATSIRVYAADGFSHDHPLDETDGAEMYHIRGTYPQATYYYDNEADAAKNPEFGWCDYSAPGCQGRSPGDPIVVDGGLKAILAYKHNGADLDPGQLSDDNKLDGEGPFRLVVPQKVPGPPDMSVKNSRDTAKWPYDENADHSAGACSRTATIIKVEPLPEGTTDINVFEDGWNMVDDEKIIVYGAINGGDANGNGILDSEEGADDNADFDGDGTADYMDQDTARFRHAKGTGTLLIHTSAGQFSQVRSHGDNAKAVCQTGKPAGKQFPYGVSEFRVTGLQNGAEVIVTLQFPENVPTDATYYKICNNTWTEVPFQRVAGNSKAITITLTDGDAATDEDGVENGTIVDPGALATPESSSAGSGSSGCFISSMF